MSELQFFQLPVLPDQGLPQAFSCDVGARSYDFALYANVSAPLSDPPETLYDLSTSGPSVRPGSPPGYLVLRVSTAGPAGRSVVMLRKLVPEAGLVHYAGALAIKCVDVQLARGNLNGPGHFGSQIVIGVAQRWA